MKKRISEIVAAVLTSIVALLFLLVLLGSVSPNTLAAPATLAVSEVEPASGPNDLDTPIVITGTDFAAPPTVTLGMTTLDDVGWISATRLTATVPWGLDPGVYTLTVENPGGDSASLTDAFTVTEAIGVWNAGELYGGSMEYVAINPDTNYPIYAVSDQVGLFRKEDETSAWEFIYPGEHLKLSISPADPDRLFLNSGYRSDGGIL